LLFSRDLDNLELHCDTAVTIGKFDGFHLGHQSLIEHALLAERRGLASMVISFDFLPLDGKKRTIMTVEEEIAYLDGLGVDYFVLIPVTEEFIRMPYDVFVKTVLVEKLRAKRVFCGSDFRFGFNRAGNTKNLTKLGEELGFETRVIPEEMYLDEPISSTRIRAYLADGKIEDVNACLGHNYAVQGEVVHGLKLAGKFGFPTANVIPNEHQLLPKFGVYDTRVCIDGVVYRAMTNIGIKPTITSDNEPVLEAHILDFSADIYGKTITVSFIRYIRAERKFDSVDALFEQVRSDVDTIRND